MAKKIMVVDDEESLRELAEAIFTQEGFEVIKASSGSECLDILKTEKPDLVLMDMMMPGMSGRETTEKIRTNPATKNLKIMFLTVARFSETGKDTLNQLNVSDYVTKPFENDELVRRVKKLIGKS
ncbi:MAG TPA: response regulator [Candidatus Nanoarchaeia archaeon]|nr:response regulator [Candidatus Nanoarchaeia archaeon]